VLEGPFDGLGPVPPLDECDDLHFPSAVRAAQGVDLKGPLDERRPSHSAQLTIGRVFVVDGDVTCLGGAITGFGPVSASAI